MKIKLQKIRISNFKGIKEKTIDFRDGQTSIFGANKAGKTTVFDAFTWLLFGKDSIDREKFNIKNTKFTELNRQDHEVEGILSIDGVETTVKRIYREKWTKKKGTTTAVLTGNEQEFFWNGVPLQAGEFAKKIDELVKEVVFKLISNPLHFNNLPWKSRREFLFKMAGDISDADIAAGNKDFEILLQTLQTKSLEEYKREISVRKTTLKDNLKSIPARIDEVSKSKPEELEWDKIEVEIKTKEHALADIDTQIADSSKANQALNDAKAERQNKIHKLKTSLRDIEFQLESDFRRVFNEKKKVYDESLNSLNDAKNKAISHLNTLGLALKSLHDKKQGLDVRRNSLRDLFITTSESQFVADLTGHINCPKCNHGFNPSDVDGTILEERRRQFNLNKSISLDNIDADGSRLKAEIEASESDIKNLNIKIEEAKETATAADEKLSAFNQNNVFPEYVFNLEIAIAGHEEYQAIKNTLLELENKIDEAVDTNNATLELIESKTAISKELDNLKTLLNRKSQIEAANKRIEQLKADEKNWSQQLADLEGAEFTINDFNKAKIEMVESRVNGKFQYVTFKMFDYTIEGNPVETCETMLDGVPFSDLNTAGKIWAGLDIINTLSQHYNVTAPVFLDNRESVTEIPYTESQIVNLFVSPEDKELRVA